ncbi:MAG: hypothetical protein QF752_02685 [Planctomycetota bacterium]|nr:hypothetical protein [Planctomycetota bacterium]
MTVKRAECGPSLRDGIEAIVRKFQVEMVHDERGDNGLTVCNGLEGVGAILTDRSFDPEGTASAQNAQ